MSINIKSEATCRQAYLNAYYYENTMNISDEDLGEIERVWADKLDSWRTRVSKDENDYIIDDDDYSTAKGNGRQQAQDKTGYEGGKGNMVARDTIDSGGAALSAIGTGVMLLANNSVVKTLGWIATCVIGLATGIAYQAKKPNKDQKEACDELQNEMGNAQADLQDTRADMEEIANELINHSDEANAANDKANETIVSEKTEFDMYRAAFEALKAKAESGEPLTEDEKALYEKLAGLMAEAGENITTTQEETSGVVGKIYDKMGTYQDRYDYAAETMGEIEGVTDFAASFDEDTKDSCVAEGIIQTVNAAACTTAGGMGVAYALAEPLPWMKVVDFAIAAMGFTGAGLSGVGAKEQFDWSGQVGTEIDLRKDTQDFNVETSEIYDDEIENYAGTMQGVEDLELEIPNDLEAPEATPLPNNGDGYPSGTPDEIKPDGSRTGGSQSNGTSSPNNEVSSNASNGYASYSDILSGKAGNSNTVFDESGQVILSSQYANAITQGLGIPAATSGAGFDSAKIPDIISKLTPGIDADTIRTVMNGGTIDSSFDATGITIFGKTSDKTVDNSKVYTKKLKSIIDFYKPILDAAASNGWKCA